LLVINKEREELQIEFFYKLFEIASCHILNTGPETIEHPHLKELEVHKLCIKP